MKARLLPLFLSLMILLGSLTSCLPFELPSPEDPDKAPESTGVFHHLGMTITLTPDFVDNSKVKEFVYTSPDCVVDGYCHPFSDIEVKDGYDFPTIVDFANLYNPTPNTHASVPDSEAIYFTYTNSFQSKTTLYVVYEDVDSFYLVRFTCDAYRFEELLPTFFEWARSVTFDA